MTSLKRLGSVIIIFGSRDGKIKEQIAFTESQAQIRSLSQQKQK